MEMIRTVSRDSIDELLARLGSRLGVDSSTLTPFTDHCETMTALLNFANKDQNELLVAGHVTPDMAIAADRAELKVVEILGASPFVSHPEDVLEATTTGREIVYLANPNWVTGSSYSFAHLDRIARAVPDGLLILDEKYFDYYGISGLPLIEQHEQVVVIRSLTAGFSIGSDQSGFIAGSQHFTNRFRDEFAWSRLTTTMYNLITTTLTNDEIASKRLSEVHDESLRVANELTQIKAQNRITATDFLLLRVADPKAVGNRLAASGTPVENLEGYPGLENYMRYRIQSPLSNDTFLTAFKRMPAEHFRMDNLDKRAVMFNRPMEKSGESKGGSRLPSSRTRNMDAEVLAAK